MKRFRLIPGLLTASLMICGSASAADYLSMSGQDLFKRFCAACHGPDGQGGGPVAKSLAVEVPDLTLIARRRSGKFPNDLVEKIIDGRHIIGAHGTRTMPVWGEEFGRSELGNPDAERATRTVIQRIADYLLQIQRLAPLNSSSPSGARAEDNNSNALQARHTQ